MRDMCAEGVIRDVEDARTRLRGGLSADAIAEEGRTPNASVAIWYRVDSTMAEDGRFSGEAMLGPGRDARGGAYSPRRDETSSGSISRVVRMQVS